MRRARLRTNPAQGGEDGSGRHRRRAPGGSFALLAALAGVLLHPGTVDASAPGGPLRDQVPVAATQQRSALRCQLCHAQPELLRQQVESPDRAERIHVSPSGLAGSAHGGMACGECHGGFDAFPHPEQETSTETCGSCHAESDGAWRSGAHAVRDGDAPAGGERGAAAEPRTTARCSDCHGVHEVQSVERLREDAGVRGMNARCVDCHATVALPDGAPHADTVACHACHRPHDVRRVETPEAAVAPAHQAATCGACHDDVASSWVDDVHGSAVTGDGVPEGTGAEGENGEEHPPPACTVCHGQHGMTRLASEVDPGREVSRCRDCHEDYADTFGDSYHGQAVALGSPASASCADCHTGHAIYPASHPRSSVAQANLVETCGTCHPEANASFVEFEPHADPHDREKNPVLYWTYKFMTFLLVSVLGVFGLHTALWVIRIAVAKVRGEDIHGGHRRQVEEGS